MARTAILKQVVSRVAKAELSAAPDRELLRRFADEGDQAAFAALVKRHTGLVLGVCRRALPTQSDAEDACQAVFLVLAKKAASQRWQPSIANWLYTTARKVARDARLAAARRARREGAAAVPEAVSAVDQMTVRELFVALDEELDRLTVLYREPLVLCYLEGLTRDEVAARLGVPAGTVKIRLERARKKLADALTGRGMALGIGLLTLATTSSAGASSPKLIESILAAAGGSPSPAVAALAQGVGMNGILTQAKWALLALAGATILGFGFAARSPGEGKVLPDKTVEDAKPPLEAKAHIVAGQVLGADGKPVVADLILLRSDGSPMPLGKSGADGRFRVAAPAGGKEAHLVARVGGQGVGYVPVSPRTVDVTLKLTKDNPIRGRVIDTQGKPVVGAVVFPRTLEDFGPSGIDFYLVNIKTKPTYYGRLHGEHSLRLGARTEFDLPGGAVLAARTDKDGRFEIAGLGAERVVGLRCRAVGMADTEVAVINRARFDPAEVNKAAADTRDRMLGKAMRNATYEKPLHGPDDLTIVTEQEKVIRGVVKDRDSGRPRPGVVVTLSRVGNEYLGSYLTATTDKDGKFAFRGCRKRSAYVSEVMADVQAGYLPTQVEVKDTAGYEPIDIEIACARGVIVTGKMTDKTTGQPLAGRLVVAAMQDNPFLKKYPPLDRGVYGENQTVITRGDGSYRFVTLPGPVLVMAGLQVSQYQVRYKPVRADPNYPRYFHNLIPGRLGYTLANGVLAMVEGCWCKVIDLKGTENGLILNIALEPAAKKLVRVIGPDGKPVPGCDATGTAERDMHPVLQGTDKVEVYGLAPKQQRFVVVGHQTKKLVGAAVVKEDDNDPVVTLGPGGSVTGRVVDAAGKPIAGMNVLARFDHPSVEGVSESLHDWKPIVTGADGTFRIDTLIPGHGFWIQLSKGPKNHGPHPNVAPRHKIEKHGDTLKLGDVKAEPRDNPTES